MDDDKEFEEYMKDYYDDLPEIDPRELSDDDLYRPVTY